MTSPVIPSKTTPNAEDKTILLDKDKRKRNEPNSKSVPTPTKPIEVQEPKESKELKEPTKLNTSTKTSFIGKGTSSWDDFEEPNVALLVKSSKDKEDKEAKDKTSLPKPIVGIQPSSLGTFTTSAPLKSSQSATPKSTSDGIFGSSFAGPTFGASFSSNTPSSFGAAAESKVTFSDMLKSPLKKKVKLAETPIDKDKHLDGKDTPKEEQEEELDPQPPLEVQEWKLKEIKPLEKLTTGEENEETRYSTRCKLFAWEEETWRERGIGLLKINSDKTDDKQIRLIMRSEGVLKVILNVRVTREMPIKMRDDKFIEIVAFEKPPSFTKFLFKLGNKEKTCSLQDELLKAVNVVG